VLASTLGTAELLRYVGDEVAAKSRPFEPPAGRGNPFNPSVTGLAVPDDTSIAQMVAKAAARSAHVVKAFNTLFRDVLAAGGRLDVFMAGDDAQAKASVSAFIKSLGLRPQDTGDLSMAHWLEGAGLLSVGVGRYGVGDFNFSLGVKFG
jgi:8-hydroxy-5-deazaflavin:NADPH oxidoreductase